ncbi:MAG: dihydroorotate dehydrogenase-like protein [Bacteroidota bacterium]
MTDLSTKYMGLSLKNPLVVGSSELTNSTSKIADLEKQGAGAVVLKSLFEEQIMSEVNAQRVNNMYGSYQEVENYVSFYTRKHDLDEYLELIRKSKQEVDIPILASINCISNGEWIDFARQMEQAGADGLELNMFILPNDPSKTSQQLEQIYFDVLEEVNKAVDLPVSMKVGSYFSGMANILVELSEKGLDGMVLFNHFYRPDIDIEEEKVRAADIFSEPRDIANTLRWIGILYDKLKCDMAASTGIHTGEGAIKALLAGAKVTQMASTLYKNKPLYIGTMLKDMKNWMKKKGYTTLADFRGKVSQAEIKQPMMYERAQFMKYYSNYSNK